MWQTPDYSTNFDRWGSNRYLDKLPKQSDKYYCWSKEKVPMTKVMSAIEVDPLTEWLNMN